LFSEPLPLAPLEPGPLADLTRLTGALAGPYRVERAAEPVLSSDGRWLACTSSELMENADYDNDTEHARFNVSPDDKRFLMSRRNTGSGTP
jgi:hypothetical protein